MLFGGLAQDILVKIGKRDFEWPNYKLCREIVYLCTLEQGLMNRILSLKQKGTSGRIEDIFVGKIYNVFSFSRF